MSASLVGSEMCIRDSDLAHELPVHEVLDDAQAHAVPGEGEVIPVNNAPDIELGVAKAARACFPADEPEALQNG
eukprot:9870835-Alexandrium_andersonii.AAC.1